MGAQRSDERSAGADDGEEHQGEAAAEAISREGDQQRGERGAREPGADDEADFLRVEVQLREVDAEQDADQPRRERAQKRRGVEDPAVAAQKPTRRIMKRGIALITVITARQIGGA